MGDPGRLFQFPFLRGDHGHGLASHGHPGVARVQTVDLHHIGPGDVRHRGVLGLQLGSGNAPAADADLLGQHVQALVLVGGQRAQLVHEDLHEPGPWRVFADVPGQLVHERVVDADRFEIVRGVQDPLRFGGHAQHGLFKVLVVLVGPLERVLLLGQPGAARAADLDAAPGRELGDSGDPRDAVPGLEQRQRHDRVDALGGCLAEGGDHQHGQVGAELLDVGIGDRLDGLPPGVGPEDRACGGNHHRSVVLGADRARQVVRPEGPGTEHDRVVGREHQRSGVGEAVGEGRDAPIERVADDRVGRRLRERQVKRQVEPRIRDQSARLGEHHRRRESDAGDRIGAPWSRCGHEAGL